MIFDVEPTAVRFCLLAAGGIHYHIFISKSRRLRDGSCPHRHDAIRLEGRKVTKTTLPPSSPAVRSPSLGRLPEFLSTVSGT